MNTDNLKHLMAVAETGSFSEAAARLGISQPAVSLSIKKMEKDLGVRLLNRTPRGYRLTAEGSSVIEHAREILAGEQRLLSAVERMKGEASGKLVAASSTIPGEYVLPLVLGEFKARYPAIELMLEVSDSRQVLREIARSRVEIGFTGLRENTAELTFHRICPDTLVVVAPPGHPLSKKASIPPERLADERFILREEGSATRELMLEVLRKHGLPLENLSVEMQLGSAGAVLSAVESGAGISLVSFWAARQPLMEKRISRLNVGKLEARRHFFLVEAGGAGLSRQGSALRDFVLDKSVYLTDFANSFLQLGSDA